MTNEKNILKVDKLSAAYGQSKVLFDVSLEVKPQEKIAIVGRNGAGKTTLLKSIAGLLNNKEGTIIFDNKDISEMVSYNVARLGLKYIDQDKQVFQDLTVRENLKLSSYITGDYEYDKVFKFFPKLKRLMDRKGAYLSGGERQMVMIGRAILGQPRVLLIDEPTEGLAPSVVSDLVSVFNEFSMNCALVMVGQNLSFVAKVAQRVYTMKEGKINREITDEDEIKEANYSKEL